MENICDSPRYTSPYIEHKSNRAMIGRQRDDVWMKSRVNLFHC